MTEPGGIGDCSYPGWYEFKNKRGNDHVGYINDCENTKCADGYTNIGELEHFPVGGWLSTTTGRKPKSGSAKNQTINTCNQTINQICGWARNDYGICQKNKDRYSQDWMKCCNFNEKFSPKNGCYPYFYLDKNTGKYSNDCINSCLGGINKLTMEKVEKSVSFKNDYKGGFCTNMFKKNEVNPSIFKEFCSSEPAYKDGKPNPEYSNICGCFYPDDYYDKLKIELLKKFPDLPESYLTDITCFSTLCGMSELKELKSIKKCPNQYFLKCVNNVDFDSNNVNNEGNLEISQSNDCKISTEEINQPYCGKNCDSNSDCPQSCPCNNNICKNDDSVNCEGNFTCSDNKITREGALCSGTKNTCNDTSCCITKIKKTSGPPGPPGPDTPKSDNNQFIKFMKNNWYWFLLGIFILIIVIVGIVVIKNKNKNIIETQGIGQENLFPEPIN